MVTTKHNLLVYLTTQETNRMKFTILIKVLPGPELSITTTSTVSGGMTRLPVKTDR